MPSLFYPYQQDTDHDIALADWWGQLKTSGDLDKLFAKDEQSMGRFMHFYCIIYSSYSPL